eukprot:365383-Chlamydomonas_euryale.AAC.5
MASIPCSRIPPVRRLHGTARSSRACVLRDSPALKTASSQWLFADQLGRLWPSDSCMQLCGEGCRGWLAVRALLGGVAGRVCSGGGLARVREWARRKRSRFG